MQLNPEQTQAINAREGAFSVLATAGSGKTTVLCERARALFREGATPDDVLALTFTVNAASEMEKRLGLKLDKRDRGGFRTFHSFCLNLVRRESKYLPYGLSSEPFPDGPVLSKMLLTAMKENGIRRKQFAEVRAWISARKRERVSPFETTNRHSVCSDLTFSRAYEKYEQLLHDGGMLDFDSMIVEAVNILEKYPEVQDRWQFKWVMCDEGQDTDNLQFLLLQLVSKKYNNVFVVGDFCQALYAFRGAHPENLVQFANWFPGARTIILPENYRSTPEIVRFSKENAPLKNELTENIRTSNPTSNIPIEFRMFAGPNEEAESTLAQAHADPGNSAVLARTNQQLGIFETLCLQHNLKFHLLGKSGLWNKPEIRTLVNLAGFCMNTRPAEKYSEQRVAPFKGQIRSMDASAALQSIIRQAKLEEFYSNDDYSEDENFAVSNIRTVADIAKRFRTLGEFLNHARKAAHASRKGKNAVTLSTVHQAKGLEWKNVFVVGVQERKMPHERGDLEEEKRIFYVAISRAAKRLRISFAGSPSTFIISFLTPEIRAQLQTYANQVEKIQRQQELFAK
jgi:DNA helicase-2/ATP-dependent DNA helicase PcrA